MSDIVQKGDVPTTAVIRTPTVVVDKYHPGEDNTVLNNKLSSIESKVDITGDISTIVSAYKNVKDSTLKTSLTIVYPASGMPYGEAPNPDTGTAEKIVTAKYLDTAVVSKMLPSGTKLVFSQAAAPTGWTKQTSVDNATIRVVSGNTGGTTGGRVAFTSAFTSKSVSITPTIGSTTLTIAQMPSHTHQVYRGDGVSWDIVMRGNEDYSPYPTTATGGSGSHTHSISAGSTTIDLNVKYTDVIICAKD